MSIEGLFSGELRGVIVGFILGSLGSIVRDWWNERKQKRRVRLLLQLEMADNLEELKKYWGVVSRNDNITDTTTAEEISAEVARNVVGTLMPPWSHPAWSAQMALVPAALREGEIAATQRFYGGLEKLAGLREQIISATQEDAENRRAGEQAEGAASAGSGFVGGAPPYMSMLKYSSSFASTAPRLGREVMVTVLGLLAGGNPLSPATPRAKWKFWE